ncbi:MAG: GNAT family N-acetyltransferase [Bacteroidales bacterium]|nr:GNAT family N-acetyltransferase [Bacteroidales bacterium]
MYKVLIRPLRIEDSDISYIWRNDPEIWRYTGSSPDCLITKEIEREWVRKVLNEQDSYRFAITVDDQYVGNIQVTDVIEGTKGQYHIFIGVKSFWAKGIASQATAQIIRFAKEKLKLQELYLSVNPNHSIAIKLYEKNGFIKVNNELQMNLYLKNSNRPLLSVCVITYNHEQFIAQSFEGILMQKTNFDFEIVVGEDCSKDNTRKIVLEYANEYPGKFKLILHKHNNGAIANQIAVLQSCSGKYVSICEGDDYWTDPYKLQKQIIFLEANPNYGLVHTDFDELRVENNKIVKSIIKSLNPKKEWQEGQEFVKWYVGGYTKIITCTVCFRKSVFDSFIDYNEFHNPLFNKMGDIQLFCTIGGNSKVKYFEESTCIKRVLKESASHSENYLKKVDFITSISNAFEYYGKKFQVPEKYYKRYNKRVSINLIKTAITRQNYPLLMHGLEFKNVKYNYVQRLLFFLEFFLYKVQFIRSAVNFLLIKIKRILL